MSSLPCLPIAICDDHPIVREGFRQLIDADGRLWVAREFSSASEVLAPAALSDIAALVLDLSLPDGNGLDVIEHLARRYPELPVVVLSMHDAPSFARDALQRGALGFVSKRAAADALPEALVAACQQQRYVSQDVRERLEVPPDEGVEALTAREHAVFVELARGGTTQEVADALGIAAKTVYVHRTSLMQKLGARTEVDLHRIARQHGLVD